MRILYIDCDSLRPDHLGCYGYHRETSPNIDELAANGRRFTNYYASDAPCLPSRTALFTGRFGINTGVINHGGCNADRRRRGPDRGFNYQRHVRSWLTVLSELGLDTVSISSFPPRHDAWHVLEGVGEYYDTGRKGNERADEVSPVAERWLEANATADDWFLHVNFWDPHTPYNTPDAYGNPFEDEPAPSWLTDDRIQDHYESYSPHGAHEPHGMGPDYGEFRDIPRMPAEITSREEYEQWIDGYDVGVHYFDHHVGKLVDRLKEAGVFEDTLIVVSADHGENLGELNVYGDHQTADDKTCRLPLIVHGPQVASDVAAGFHYQVDLPPTITELVGGTPPAGWDGRSFASTVTDGADVGRDFLVLSQGAWACQRGVRWDDWLLLRTYHDGFKGSLEDVMLFDLVADPHETTNLAGTHPGVVDRGLSILNEWVDGRLLAAARGRNGVTTATADGITDPMMNVLREGGPFHTRGYLDPFARRLRETGREDCAEELLENHAAD